MADRIVSIEFQAGTGGYEGKIETMAGNTAKFQSTVNLSAAAVRKAATQVSSGNRHQGWTDLRTSPQPGSAGRPARHHSHAGGR